MFKKHVMCTCGKDFYCTSINPAFVCLYCGTEHQLDEVPDEEAQEEEA